jgi:phthalate 3,4-dioxygenase ferredoxin reductase subunit
MNTTVIVGSSVAGARAARSLRSEGYSGRVRLVGEETAYPYDKPPLSKTYLAGTADDTQLTLLTPEQARAEEIELSLGRRACGVDLASGEVELDDGSRLGFDQLVVATGARPRRPPWPTPPGVHVLRSLADAEALRADLAEASRLVVIGAGVIGAEIAATARRAGREVTLIDPLPGPMHRVVGARVAERVAELHRRHGVRTLFGTGVEGIGGTRGGLQVRLDDGRALAADTVLVGIGAEVNDGWLATSGLRLDDGVLCDQYCRSVSAPHVFAAGDVARWFHPGVGGHVRTEHWTNAVMQAACVAHNIAHPEDLRGYGPTPYVWSDQFDWHICVVGETSVEPAETVEGPPGADGTRFAALYCSADRTLTGAVVVNWPRALMRCRVAVEQRQSIEELRIDLTDELSRRPAGARGTSMAVR